MHPVGISNPNYQFLNFFVQLVFAILRTTVHILQFYSSTEG